MRRFRPFHSRLAAAALFASGGAAHAISIVFDYSHDTNNFFSGANIGRRTYLDAAAQAFSLRLTDNLSAITPSGDNSWSAGFYDPSSGNYVYEPDLQIAANEIRIFAGGRIFNDSTLGVGGPGGYSYSITTQAWVDTVKARGQTGALNATPTDFGPWGGSITFDLDSPWYFDPDVTTRNDIPVGKDDFYSVALHELAHVLGFGTADSWKALEAGTTFNGTHATAANGNLHVSLSGDLGHWVNGTQSKIYGTNISQEAAMDPSLLIGSRKEFTNLDFAGLQDVGWQLAAVPEPGSAALLVMGVAVLANRRRR